MKPEDFIEHYGTALKTQKWTNVAPLIHDKASVTFSNGAVHQGKNLIKIAFEKNFSLIKNEEYTIHHVRWLLRNDATAVYLFEFSWTGIINDKRTSGSGLGTSVVVNESGKWVLLTEHLGKKPVN